MGQSHYSASGQYVVTPAGAVNLETGELGHSLIRPGPVTGVIPGDPAGCPRFVAWVRQEVTEHPEKVRSFCRNSLLGTVRGPRLLAKGDLQRSDLLRLWEVLSYVLGGYVGRLSRGSWEEWPDRLSSQEREILGEARLIFLPAIERHERFPQVSTEEMLAAGVAGWFYCRGRQYPCAARFYYPTPLRKIERLEESLSRQLLLLPTARGAALTEGPEGFLAEEAPHILAWLITPSEAKR